MSALTSEETTFTLPESVALRVRETARLWGKDPNRLVAELVSSSLTDEAADAAKRVHARSIELGDNPAVRAEAARAALAPTRQALLSELLARNRSSRLTGSEESELDALLDEVEALAVERAAAMLAEQNRRAK